MTDTTSIDNLEPECNWAPVFLARQPIFDVAMEIWGHLMLYRETEKAEQAEFENGFDATTTLLAHIPLAGLDYRRLEQSLVHFPARAVVDGMPRAMPPDNTVVTVQEDPHPQPDYIKALVELKNEGYSIAVDNFKGRAGAEGLVALADVLTIDTLDIEEEELERLTAKARLMCPTLLAKRIEIPLALETAKRLGFTLFHGYFFKRPVTAAGRKIPSTAAAKLKLFDIIEKEEPDFDGLTRAVEPDVAVSYRLLNFLNSAHFGFRQKITSIHQAVVLAGWKPVRNWLRIILLTDLAPSSKSRELAYLSAHRAKFLETAARCGGHEDKAESVFTLGLFSLLDALFGLSMPLILKQLPLAEDIQAALLDGSGPLAEWLTLAKTIEDGAWESMGKAALRLRLPPGSVADAYRSAYTWCDTVFGAIGDASGAQRD